jgi:multisubunit Na+/H+ antiporter MnhC subunit
MKMKLKAILLIFFKSFDLTTIIFLWISAYLILQKDTIAIILGSLGLVWWILIFLVNFYKNLKQHNSKTI